ncbi:FRG domain-containing protein [Myroides sp. JBRI-B21084]|uniref:FRG domain-containing protein n=1 Tax=Myroides sp. JBRI-B21084 TaxID=3119977 RepID=UPI0026E28AEA|nr:FRG domain-containing protein [Paenimyroides cloacae]WKW45509.1 FRG domain-containing protein [Paenimyroides cloacae]
MREISNLDIKIQLTNEYLRTGGVQRIFDVDLLQDLINVKFDNNGKALPETITPRLNAFMLAILHSHSLPPLQIDNQIAEYGSFIQKSTFFDQQKIETKEQVDELLEKFKDTKNILFRGQREAKWRLYSTLQRFWIWDKMNENGEDYPAFLKGIIENGRKEYENQISAILKEINVDSLNDISVLGYLQHHNCPTPLLDWTYNFKTALFFGVDGLENYESPREIDKYFSVYFIEEEHFDSGGMRTLLNESLQTVGEQLKLGLIAQIAKDEEQQKEMETHFKKRSFFDKNRLNGAGLVKHMTKIEHMVNIPLSFFSDNDFESGIAFSLTNSENIKRQEGVFTWNADFSKPLEVIGNEQYSEAKLESEPDDYRFCECYNINKDLSDYIVQKLTEANISKATMYPDKDIDTRHIYDNNKKASS